ncbi:ArsR/SmtB family transcription factor [Streptomyces hesseae]|uniref:Metalloregulator ArsR/SmtB family transcription factor n=1 Tax=Streptomyces hesseae TaxID=3075519 RepID=A0ABU2SL52_9ACTN|nr:metalloregulator ArsR/SmtB family transcription factor [Streptomyces sp. DSM 40473]MDT0449717.1 metalloregulator ArsR/SmtB family transcription factor [Streptomyces sp. DSM 40473]
MDAHGSPDAGPAFEQAVAVLKAVADPTRFHVLWALAQREHSVGQLAEMAGAHVAAVSQHLARLRAVGLVVPRREGTRIFYRVAGDHVRTLLEGAMLVAQAGPEAGAEGGPAPAETAPARETALAKRAVRRLRPRATGG